MKKPKSPEAPAPLQAARTGLKFGWPLACIYLLAITVTTYLPALLPGRTFLPADLVMLIPPWSHHAHEIAPDFHAVARPVWDPLFQFYPSRKFLAESIHAGTVPWHNPYSFSGTPFVADGQSAVFYPINWLYAILPLASAFGIVAALHTFLAGLFFTLFARHKGMAWESSLAGATVWMLCGTMAAWQMWQVVDAALCWIPLGLFFADRIVNESSTKSKSLDIAGLAIALGMMLLAGHLQFAFYGLTIIALYAIVCAWARRRFSTLLPALLSLIAALAIASIQILPTLELLHNSLRSNYSLDQLLQTALPAPQLGLMLMPDIAGGERDWMAHPYIGAVNYYETACYCGAAALFFVALAFWKPSGERRVAVWFWSAIAVLGLLIGCGSPFYAALYYGAPLFKSFHGVARALVLTELSVAILCSLGIQNLVEKGSAEIRPVLPRMFGACLIVLVALYGLIASRSTAQLATILTHDWLIYGLSDLARALILIGVCAVLAAFGKPKLAWVSVAIVAVDMLSFASGLSPGADSAMLYPQIPAVQEMQQAAGTGRVLCLGDSRRDLDRMIPNSAMSIGLHDISGSDPLILSSYDSLIASVNTAQTGSPSPNGEGIFAVGGSPYYDNLNVATIISPAPISNPPYQLISSGDVYIYRNLGANGEAWLVGLNGQAAFITPFEVIVKSTSSTQRIAIDTQSNLAKALIVSEIADPCWKVSLDGKPASLLPNLLVVLNVPAGYHRHRSDLLSNFRQTRPLSRLPWLAIDCVSGHTWPQPDTPGKIIAQGFHGYARCDTIRDVAGPFSRLIYFTPVPFTEASKMTDTNSDTNPEESFKFVDKRKVNTEAVVDNDTSEEPVISSEAPDDIDMPDTNDNASADPYGSYGLVAYVTGLNRIRCMAKDGADRRSWNRQGQSRHESGAVLN